MSDRVRGKLLAEDDGLLWLLLQEKNPQTPFDTWVKEVYSHKILSFVIVVTWGISNFILFLILIFYNRLERGISTSSSWNHALFLGYDYIFSHFVFRRIGSKQVWSLGLQPLIENWHINKKMTCVLLCVIYTTHLIYWIKWIKN